MEQQRSSSDILQPNPGLCEPLINKVWEVRMTIPGITAKQELSESSSASNCPGRNTPEVPSQQVRGHTPTLLAQLKTQRRTVGVQPTSSSPETPPPIFVSEPSSNSNYRAEAFVLIMAARHLSSIEETPNNTVSSQTQYMHCNPSLPARQTEAWKN